MNILLWIIKKCLSRVPIMITMVEMGRLSDEAAAMDSSTAAAAISQFINSPQDRKNDWISSSDQIGRERERVTD